MSTQPQQQQQSSSEEGSKENTIVNGLRHQKERSAQGHPSGPADSVPQGPAPYSTYTYIANWRTTTGSPQSTIRTKITRIYQNTMEPTNGSTRTPAHNKGPGAANGRNKMSETSPWSVIRHRFCYTALLNHLRTLSNVQHVAEVAIESRNWPYYNFCDFCRVTTHSTHMCRAC